MQIEISKKFLSDLQSLTDDRQKQVEDFVFNVLPNTSSIFNLKNVEKLSGFKNYYKVRFGDYRLGIYYDKKIIKVLRILHRKNIYRRFP